MVTTARHPRVSGARRLARRTFRYADRTFLVEGPSGVREALADPAGLLELFVTAEARARYADLVAAADAAGVPVHDVSEPVMAQLAQTVTPQGLVGVAPFRDVALDDALAPGLKLAVVLAHARDPGNAGTILRTADAAGADAVLFTDSSVDPYNPKCARATAGSLFHVPFVIGVPVAAAIEAARAAGLAVLAADSRGEVSLDDVDLARPTAWLFGNEAWGLPPEVADRADARVAVPMFGRAESLNLASAAAVCLYASARAQRGSGGSRA